MKLHLVGAELFHADGQIDRQTDKHMAKLLIAFRIFAHAPHIILETALLLPSDTWFLFTRWFNTHTYFHYFLQCYPLVTKVVRLLFGL
jgi:hypothetical protein